MKTHENPNRQLTRVKAIALPAAAKDNMWPHKRSSRHRKSRNKEHRNQLLLLAVSITVVGLLGALVWDFIQIEEDKVTGRFQGTEHNAVLGITIFIQSMIAFFGILNLEELHSSKVSPLTKGGMRCAIAGTLVVTYIFLVIFHTMVDFAAGQPLITPAKPITDQFVNSFTGIVGLTIAFYFASEAGIHAMNSFKPAPNPHHTRLNGSTSKSG